MLVFVQHHIENIVNAADGTGLLNVLPDGISLQFSGAGVFADHLAVIALNGRPGGNSRHNRLGAAAVTGKIMVLNISQADPAVCLRHSPKHIYRRSVGSDSHMNAIGRVRVYALNFRVSPLPGQFLHFFRRVVPVASQSKH